MGNKNSKNRRESSSRPAFTRSDTQTSTRSGFSIKSSRSRRSTGANGGDETRAQAQRVIANSTAVTPSDNPDYAGSEYPFSQVPRSLQIHEPMESILIYRDKDGNITNPLTSDTSVSAGAGSGPNGAAATAAADSGTAINSTSGSTESAAVSDDTNASPPAGNGNENVNWTQTETQGGAGAAAGTGSVNISGNGTGTGTGPGSTPGSVDAGHPGFLNIPRREMPTLSTSGPDGGPLTPMDPAMQYALPFGASPRTPGASHVISGPQGNINIDETIQLLLDAGYSGKTTRTFCLKGSEIAAICKAAREIFLSQPTLLELQPPVKIVGDTHGQYGDLLRLFNMCGFPPEANYLFLGDYVDRGKQSLETMMLLLCYKIKYPGNFFILRGNHECAGITRIYGFYDECKRRASVKTWRTFIDTFNTLPIAAVVAGKIFCVHGGLSPSLTSINDIRGIERPTDVPDYGLLNDLLWSDPTDGPNEWEDNERGVSYCYNKVAINKFNTRFGYDLVCRAHMVVEDGYEFFNDRSLVTVFSAPNYCGEFDNWGAVMSVSEDLLCSFELLKPLDSAALKDEMKREKHERRNSQLAQSF